MIGFNLFPMYQATAQISEDLMYLQRFCGWWPARDWRPALRADGNLRVHLRRPAIVGARNEDITFKIPMNGSVSVLSSRSCLFFFAVSCNIVAQSQQSISKALHMRFAIE